MTDITELAQSLKAAANTTADAIDRLKAFPGDELIDLSQHEGEQVDIDITTLNEWYELSSPANILALVEALEKAQRANAAQDDHINQQQDRIESLEKKNAELGKYAGGLESFRTAYMEWSDKTDWVQTDKRFDFLKPWGKHRADVLKAYIEHLESRAVTFKLPSTPEPSAFAPWVAKAFYQFHKDTVKSCVAVFSDACRAAGIKVEAE
ncbi:hypothetical protein JKA54_24935 [Klebsiella pneumoniae]|uniref:hypothetical protein n=1 Tax=Klebsiella pneumoniae TaxID=573 RepID=UPI001912676E|nr:hypothetical protein [Klebsiella pneumoniae]MBK5755078.1 hypothetical protein [Klebsiella pneumoniae]